VAPPSDVLYKLDKDLTQGKPPSSLDKIANETCHNADFDLVLHPDVSFTRADGSSLANVRFPPFIAVAAKFEGDRVESVPR
jgi:hypothetical protein